MKEKIWGKIALARKEAWGLLMAGLLLGIVLAFCSEASSVFFVARQVQKLAGYQQQTVWAATLELANELEAEAMAEALEAEKNLENQKDSAKAKESSSLNVTKNGILVAVDPGHLGRTYQGYVNVGAVSTNGITEYEFTLEIGLLLKEELISRGYDVLMIRETNDRKNYKLDAGERAQMANEAECDILVALHWDSNDDPTHHGYHTIYKGNKQTESYRLALAISDAYGEAVEGNIAKLRKPMKRTDLWELNAAKMPTTFIEMGYASNESDALWLTNSENHPIIVEGIANGIDDFFFPDDVIK